MSSSVPAAVASLHTSLAALEDSGTIVHFGPPMRDAEAAEHLTVAHSPGGGDVIDTSSDWASLGYLKQEERYEVACALVVWSGESTEASVRAAFLRAYVLFAEVTAAVAANPTLTNSVREARVSSHSTAIDQTDQGEAVTLTFRVACASRVTY